MRNKINVNSIKYKAAMLPKEEFKVNIENGGDYRTLRDILNSNNMGWYSLNSWQF